MWTKIQKIVLFCICLSIALSTTALTAYAGTPQVDDNIFVAVGYTKTIPCSLDSCQGKRKNWTAESRYFSITSTGNLKGISEGVGTATITTEQNETKTCNVYVTPAASLSSSTGSIKLMRGKSKKIDVSVSPQNACSDLIWTSSNSNIAKVENGLVTATGLGKCDIYCKTNDGGSGYISFSVNVKNPSTTKPKVSKKPTTTKKKTTTKPTTKKVTTTKKHKTTHKETQTTKRETYQETTKKPTTTQPTTSNTTSDNNTTNNTTTQQVTENTTDTTIEDGIYYTGSNEMQDYNIRGVSKKKKPIKIEWNKIEGITGYQLYCSLDMKNFALIYDGTNNYYEQHHFQNGKTYYYYVRSYTIKNGIKITDFNSDVLVQKAVNKSILSRIF